jgi:hypothetical protein
MRQVTSQVVRAFHQGKKKTVDNTSTDGQAIYLHGNKIVRRTEDGGIEISTAGWGHSSTTRERLNAFASVSQKNWQLYLNGQPWDGKWTKV